MAGLLYQALEEGDSLKVNMTKAQYIEWYREKMSQKPPEYLLEKHEFLPEPEEEIQQFCPIRCKMKFGRETEG